MVPEFKMVAKNCFQIEIEEKRVCKKAFSKTKTLNFSDLYSEHIRA
jgi:hypothetical protein